MLILIVLPLIYVLVFLHLSRSHYRIADLGLKSDVYGQVVYTHLDRALAQLPLKTAPFLCQADLLRIYLGKGRIWQERAKKKRV